MTVFVTNISEMVKDNSFYRQVVFTSHYTQLVLMSLKPNEEIGNEIHGLDQFIRVEQGHAKVILNNGEIEYELHENWVIIIPAGNYHNVINIGKTELKLTTLYSPPDHLKTTLQKTKADELEDHFDGSVSE
ncbi:MAG: cupin domain-containing protein [Candidatus Saccharimonadia bacterium]